MRLVGTDEPVTITAISPVESIDVMYQVCHADGTTYTVTPDHLVTLRWCAGPHTSIQAASSGEVMRSVRMQWWTFRDGVLKSCHLQERRCRRTDQADPGGHSAAMFSGKQPRQVVLDEVQVIVDAAAANGLHTTGPNAYDAPTNQIEWRIDGVRFYRPFRGANPRMKPIVADTDDEIRAVCWREFDEASADDKHDAHYALRTGDLIDVPIKTLITSDFWNVAIADPHKVRATAAEVPLPMLASEVQEDEEDHAAAMKFALLPLSAVSAQHAAAATRVRDCALSVMSADRVANDISILACGPGQYRPVKAGDIVRMTVVLHNPLKVDVKEGERQRACSRACA
jgi:hypothetical protein